MATNKYVACQLAGSDMANLMRWPKGYTIDPSEWRSEMFDNYCYLSYETEDEDENEDENENENENENKNVEEIPCYVYDDNVNCYGSVKQENLVPQNSKRSLLCHSCHSPLRYYHTNSDSCEYFGEVDDEGLELASLDLINRERNINKNVYPCFLMSDEIDKSGNYHAEKYYKRPYNHFHFHEMRRRSPVPKRNIMRDYTEKVSNKCTNIAVPKYTLKRVEGGYKLIKLKKPDTHFFNEKVKSKNNIWTMTPPETVRNKGTQTVYLSCPLLSSPKFSKNNLKSKSIGKAFCPAAVNVEIEPKKRSLPSSQRFYTRDNTFFSKGHHPLSLTNIGLLKWSSSTATYNPRNYKYMHPSALLHIPAAGVPTR